MYGRGLGPMTAGRCVQLRHRCSPGIGDANDTAHRLEVSPPR